jgi:hypothetical protein
MMVLCVSATACGGGRAAAPEPGEARPAGDAGQPRVAPSAPAPPEGPRSFGGTLRYGPPSPVKSVEAYLAREFVVVGDGEELYVLPRDAATRERLIALDGKKVHVECVVERATPPDPLSSYPLGADGQAMPRPNPCLIDVLRAE